MMNDEDEDYEYCMMTDVLYAMYFLFICMWCISKLHQWKTAEVEEDLVSFPVFKSLSKRDRDAIAGGFVFFDAWHFYLW